LAVKPHAGTEILTILGKRTLAPYHRPEGPARRRFPAVLFLHGFPGVEKSVDVQRELLARGVASLAPHAHGAWGSAGVYRFTTLVPQARAALRALRRLPFVDPDRVAVYGFSMGGWTALNLAAEEPGLRGVAVVAPVGGPELIGPGTRDFLARLSRPLAVPSQRVLLEDFRRALSERDPARAVARLRTPLLLVHGDADDVIPIEVSRRLAGLAAGRVRLVVERGGGHDFLDRRASLARRTARWLADRLTLSAL
jgi:dipeptidyl aminopeptidase/acylaminoacyl peptidase